MGCEWAEQRTFAELIDEGALEIGDGYRAKNEELGGSGPIFLRAGHVTDTHIDFSGVERFHAELAPRVRPKLSIPGDAVVTTKGNSTGRTTFVTPSMPPFVYSPHLSYWRSRDRHRIEGGFLRYWSKGPEFSEQLAGMKASTDMAPYLSLVDQKRLRISLPPIAEQRAIAHILGTLDNKIELNRRMSETLEAMARALFKSWFVGFGPVRAKAEGREPRLRDDIANLFPDALAEHPDLGEIPEGWEAAPLSAFAELNPESWSRSTAPETVRYIDLANTKWGSITSIAEYPWDEAPSRARRVLRPWDTIIGTVRPGNGSYTLVMEQGLTGSTGFAVLRPREPRHRSLVYCAATSRDNIDRLSHLADGAAYPAVRPDVVTATWVIAAPDAVLDLFARAVDPLLAKIAAEAQESRTLAALRDTLLPKLISGELRLENAEKFMERVAP